MDEPPLPQTECRVCAMRGIKSTLRRPPGHIICDTCQTDMRTGHPDEVAAWLYDLEQLLRNRNPCLFAASMEGLSGSRSAELLNDAWWNITLKKYNVGIIVLGTLLEATLQDVLYVHRYERFRGELRALTDYLRSERIVDGRLLDFVDSFRENVRNRWQHQKAHEITAGGSIHGVAFEFDPDKGAGHILDTVHKIRAGELPMTRMTVETDPVVEVVLKMRLDEDLAVPLYNRVWLWVNLVTSRYLHERHYKMLHARYAGPPAEWVSFQGGKRKTVKPSGNIGDALRALDRPIRDQLPSTGSRRIGALVRPWSGSSRSRVL
jgi:hypothetical protein